MALELDLLDFTGKLRDEVADFLQEWDTLSKDTPVSGKRISVLTRYSCSLANAVIALSKLESRWRDNQYIKALKNSLDGYRVYLLRCRFGHLNEPDFIFTSLAFRSELMDIIGDLNSLLGQEMEVQLVESM